MENSASFGAWLQRRRKQLDLTQEALAQRVACSVATIRKIEADERRPSREIAQLLATILAIPTDQHARFLRIARGELRIDHLEAVPAIPPSPIPEVAPPAPGYPPGTPWARSSLPHSPTPLIGRNAELAGLRHLLTQPDCRLLTVVGPGGIGKTRLALAVAQTILAASEPDHPKFPDGVYLVALAPLRSPEFMVDTIANTVGLLLAGASEPQTQLLNHLRTQQMLLVLDNIEHLLDGVGLLVEILQHAPTVKLLVTSRERLNLQGEWVFDLQGLPVPSADQLDQLVESSAVALFVERAQRLRPGFALAAHNQVAIAHICRLVEGMPLGIELAAAWTPTLSCREIAQEIERSLDFLATAQRGAPERHRSLRATFDYTWKLLTADERQVLARLAVLHGPFARPAAEQIARASLPTLSALINKSLLQRVQPAGQAANEGAPRYNLHELLRQYLLEKLAERGEIELVQQRHAHFFVVWAERVEAQLYKDDASRWRHTLAVEQDNLRGALHWCVSEGYDPVLGVRLAGALGRFWYESGQWREGCTWLTTALAQSTPADPARAQALTALGHLQLNVSEYATALLHLQAALTMWRAWNDQRNTAWTLYLLGYLASVQGDHRQASSCGQESLAISRSLGDRWHTALALGLLGNAAIEQGEYTTALALIEESLPILRALQSQGSVASALNLLGQIALEQNDAHRALGLFGEALLICQTIEQQTGIAWSRLNLGLAEVRLENSNAAAAHFSAALRINQELDDKGGVMAGLEGLAATAALQQQPQKAVSLLAAAEGLRTMVGQALSCLEQRMHDHTLALTRHALDETGWAAAWQVGKALSLAQAVDLARYSGEVQ